MRVFHRKALVHLVMLQNQSEDLYKKILYTQQLYIKIKPTHINPSFNALALIERKFLWKKEKFLAC